MRLSKTALLVLGIGIFVIALVAMYYINSRQSGQQKQLNESLASAQALLPKLVAERQDLEGQLTQSQGKVDEVILALSRSEGRFPKSVDSTNYDETLFEIADDCNLEVVSLTVSEPSDEKVKGTDITYTVTTFKVVVRSKETPPSTVEDFETFIDETVAIC